VAHADYAAVEDFRRRFKLLEIELVLDVGANAGQFRDMLRNTLGYSGEIVSFEPVPHLAEALAKRAAADPNWTVMNIGVGASPGSVPFNVMVGDQFSSFLTPRHDAVPLFVAENRVAEQVLVEISTLELILPPLLQKHAPRGIFLKVDTQGYDLEVLKGAGATLQLIAGLQFEASVQPIYEGAPHYQEVLQFLEEHGFVLSGIFSNNAGHFPLLVEFDCQMVRSDFAQNRTIASVTG
jgi:FkbM family methyltransferase